MYSSPDGGKTLTASVTAGDRRAFDLAAYPNLLDGSSGGVLRRAARKLTRPCRRQRRRHDAGDSSDARMATGGWQSPGSRICLEPPRNCGPDHS
ncbi:hypothetical protein GCM10020220_104110 [Nonomuraea rubra]